MPNPKTYRIIVSNSGNASQTFIAFDTANNPAQALEKAQNLASALWGAYDPEKHSIRIEEQPSA